MLPDLGWQREATGLWRVVSRVASQLARSGTPDDTDHHVSEVIGIRPHTSNARLTASDLQQYNTWVSIGVEQNHDWQAL